MVSLIVTKLEMCYQWKQREYENTKIRELTPEEKKQFNKNLVDFIEID